jgi:hypothetical protein
MMRTRMTRQTMIRGDEYEAKALGVSGDVFEGRAKVVQARSDVVNKRVRRDLEVTMDAR